MFEFVTGQHAANVKESQGKGTNFHYFFKNK